MASLRLRRARLILLRPVWVVSTVLVFVGSAVLAAITLLLVSPGPTLTAIYIGTAVVLLTIGVWAGARASFLLSAGTVRGNALSSVRVSIEDIVTIHADGRSGDLHVVTSSARHRLATVATLGSGSEAELIESIAADVIRLICPGEPSQ